MQLTVVNCHQCRYTYELNTEDASDASIEENDDAFHTDCIQQGTEYADFCSHVPVDTGLPCVVFLVLLSHMMRVKSSSIVEEGYRHDPEPIPNYQNTQCLINC